MKKALPELAVTYIALYLVSAYESCIVLAGVNRSVEILEVDMAVLRYSPEGLVWPKFLPAVDGAMLW